MAGKAQVKRIRVTKSGEPARVLTFTTRGAVNGVLLYFVHRYNPPEFDELVGKDEGFALAWLVAHNYRYEYIMGK